VAHYRRTLVSGRDPEATFSYMADFSHAAEWDPGTRSSVRTDAGELGVGSAFDLVVSTGGGRTTTMTYRITEYQPSRRVVLVGESPSVRSVDTIVVAGRADGGSLLTYDAELTLKGRLRWLDPLLTVPFRRIGDNGVAGLRKALSSPDLTEGDRGAVGAIVDELLEATVAASFTGVGPRVRQSTSHWSGLESMEGRVVLVTGATSGIGQAAAVELARLGATVVVGARSEARAESTVSAIAAQVPKARLSVLLGDLGDLDAVRAMAETFCEHHGCLDVLVHNAGALTKERTLTRQGNEVTVATQLLGPYLLTGLLWSRLAAAAPARVIQVSSGGLYSQRFDRSSLEMDAGSYDGTVAYAKVKRAQLVLMHEWVRRTMGSGVQFHAMHPGWVDTPGIRDSLPGFSRMIGPLLRTPAEGADTIAWLASSPAGATRSGEFWLDRQPRWEHKVPWTRRSPDQDVTDGGALWAWCAERTGWGADWNAGVA